MTEILFTDSAAGSMAAGMSAGGRIGVAVSVLVRQENGQRPPRAQLRKIQREHEKCERENWERAIPLDGNREDIFCFPLALGTGDISADALGPERRAALEKLMAVYPPDVKDAVGGLLEKARKDLERLLERAADGEPLRVWTGSGPDDSCGLCWLMDRLLAAGLESADVTVVTLPDFEERDNRAVVRYSGWGDVSPYQWGRMAELGRKLPSALVRASASRWALLRRENAPLRAVLNGELVSVPEDFYDSFILRELDKRDNQFSEAALIGDVLGKYRLGIGDAWLALRIEALISRGLLRPVTEPEKDGPVYRRTLCKCD